MKVAIIGAGISGLSCAVELKKHGITPTIYEKMKILGDKPGYLVSSLRLFHRAFRTPMGFMNRNYGLNITPIHPIKEMVMISPEKSYTSKGNHGFVFNKGTIENSIEHQIISGFDIPIQFDSYIEIDDIKNDFDHIVVATADIKIIKDMNMWSTTTFTAKVRIATVSGDFKLDTMTIWLNKRYARNGYGYLIAKSRHEAELVLAVSDILLSEMDFYWNEFLTIENLKYTIIKYQDIAHLVGYPKKYQFDNIYLTGNSGGMIDDFLGFGMQRGIESGILSARAIINNLDYNLLVKPFIKEIKALHEYRKMINALSNKEIDILFSFIGLPGIKHMLYNNPVYKAWQGAAFPKLITAIKNI